jgi:hypothetical protein
MAWVRWAAVSMANAAFITMAYLYHSNELSLGKSGILQRADASAHGGGSLAGAIWHHYPLGRGDSL